MSEDANASDDISDNIDICNKSLANLFPDIEPSQIDEIDTNQGGWGCDEFIFVGARPGEGKSTFGRFLFNKYIMSGQLPALFACENGKQMTMKVLACSKAGVDENRMRIKDIATQEDTMKVTNAYAWYYERKFFIEDTSYITDICNKIDVMATLHGVRMFLVDHLHAIQVPDYLIRDLHLFNRKQQLDYIIKELDYRRKKHQVPIMVFGQLNRNAQNEVPQISDCKDTGNIEEFFSTIILIHTLEKGVNENDFSKGLVDFLIRKNRYGKCGSFRRHFYKVYGKFSKI